MSLIDNVFNSVAREVNKVQTRSQDLMQTMSLQNQINELERRKTMRLAEMGKVVFDEKHNHAPAREDEVKRLCDEVASLEAEMAVLQAEIDKVKAKNDPDATPSQKAEAKAGYSATPNFFCPGCGTPANRDKRFCPSCGESLKEHHANAKAPNGDGDGGMDPIDVDVEA